MLSLCVCEVSVKLLSVICMCEVSVKLLYVKFVCVKLMYVEVSVKFIVC